MRRKSWRQRRRSSVVAALRQQRLLWSCPAASTRPSGKAVPIPPDLPMRPSQRKLSAPGTAAGLREDRRRRLRRPSGPGAWHPLAPSWVPSSGSEVVCSPWETTSGVCRRTRRFFGSVRLWLQVRCLTILGSWEVPAGKCLSFCAAALRNFNVYPRIRFRLLCALFDGGYSSCVSLWFGV